jgi:outer membrane receptor protein involved in Fe transport
MNESANAGYANLLLKFGDALEVNGGVRVENTMRKISYRNPGSFDDPFVNKNYNNIYVLPSLNVKYAATEKSNFRFAASKSYTRPVTMEVFPLEYINPDGTSIVGNKYLKNSDNYNADLKFEFFPTSKEMASITVFGKQIQNPIERTFSANAGGAVTSFSNSNNATIYGTELEFLLDLERLNKNLSAFSWGFNTSLMQTKVKVDDITYIQDDATGLTTPRPSIETHKNRQLQGASNWVVNSDLKYQFDFSKNWKNTVSLVYSLFGKRVYAVGSAGLDHIYELPVNKLDFVWNNKLSEKWDLKLSADNILNPDIKYEMGNDSTIKIIPSSRIISDSKKGIGFSFNLSYKF